MKKALIIGSVVLLLAGGIYYYSKQINLLSNFTYKLTGIHLGAISMTKSAVDLFVRIYSPSTIEAKITNLDLDIFIDNIKVGHITDLAPIIVPAKAYSDISLKVEFNPLELGSNAINLLGNYYQHQDSIILMTGFATVKSAFIQTTVPFHYETTIKAMLST